MSKNRPRQASQVATLTAHLIRDPLGAESLHAATVWSRPARAIRMVNATGNPSSPVSPILKNPLPVSAKNGIRKLFQENRQSFVEALMHRFVLVPEGRTDAEWLKLLASCAGSDQDLGVCGNSPPFLTVFGIVPTHDACIADTAEKIKDIRTDVIALADGDKAGDDYIKALLKISRRQEHRTA